jgi:hypothetical protein
VAKPLLKKKIISPIKRKIKSRKRRLIPSFFPAGLVEKQPQFKFTPLRTLVEIAMRKMTRRKDIKSEALSQNMPKIRKSPAKSSTQGRVTAKTFIKKPGRIL